MGRPYTLDMPEDVHEALLRVSKWADWTPEQFIEHWLFKKILEIDNDPLIKLAGCITSDLPDASNVSERHDEYFGGALLEETRGGG